MPHPAAGLRKEETKSWRGSNFIFPFRFKDEDDDVDDDSGDDDLS